jgi:hypothetical protein
VLSRKRLLGSLFIGVCPVKDLFLNELARGQRSKRCAGKIEIRLGSDGQELGFLS